MFVFNFRLGMNKYIKQHQTIMNIFIKFYDRRKNEEAIATKYPIK